MGNGTTTSSNTFVLCATNARSIAAGQFHSLMVRQDGKVLAWGLNNEGQLGDGTTTSRVFPVQVQGNVGISDYAMGMAGGYRHTLILTEPE